MIDNRDRVSSFAFPINGFLFCLCLLVSNIFTRGRRQVLSYHFNVSSFTALFHFAKVTKSTPPFSSNPSPFFTSFICNTFTPNISADSSEPP